MRTLHYKGMQYAMNKVHVSSGEFLIWWDYIFVLRINIKKYSLNHSSNRKYRNEAEKTFQAHYKSKKIPQGHDGFCAFELSNRMCPTVLNLQNVHHIPADSFAILGNAPVYRSGV